MRSKSGKFAGGRRGSIDTPFLVIAFIVIVLVVLAFFVRFGSMVEESPGETIASEMSYGQVSEVDLREILDKAYMKAAEEEMGSDNYSRVDMTRRFDNYSSRWVRDYFEKRGIYNVSVNVTSRGVPAEEVTPQGSKTVMRVGDYMVSVGHTP